MFKKKRKNRTHDGNQVIFSGGIFRDESQCQALRSNVLTLTLGQGLLERLPRAWADPGRRKWDFEEQKCLDGLMACKQDALCAIRKVPQMAVVLKGILLRALGLGGGSVQLFPRPGLRETVGR